MPNLNFEQILNRTETLNVKKTYNYIKQPSINGKPSVISGNEDLKIYPLEITLHHSFCNPQKVINEVEQKAKNREIINYFQNGRYVGNYVISNYQTDIKQKLDDVIIFAKIKIELLEYPNAAESFQQNSVITAVLSQIFRQNSIIIQNILINAGKIIKSTIFNSVIASHQTRTVSGLSPSTNILLQKLTISAINDIQKSGLSNAQKIVNNYTKNLNLEAKEKIIVINELNKLPNELTNAALRNV